jgi:hypothetical protein
MIARTKADLAERIFNDNLKQSVSCFEEGSSAWGQGAARGWPTWTQT